ncbi:MAG: chromosome segregation protein SMC [Candidatus Latescibacteria bacterium]|nr:chromosome segregation protein SMC [Candidatus Latescibacterota bacterium]
MRLSHLHILGFKSFADKLDIAFSDGITAVVGPNGCGKTNIVDAIRWVLGEQRATVLRGGRMEDVIFNGSARRKPLGMAEVSLTIENTKHLLPIEYSEVTITRRVFRSGESEYLLNKVPCRLKDITDLFLDTGMGTHAYSMIEQSMVDAIVNGSPLERRLLIEEAAGINKYKTRRKLAERKLESTEHDLVRIADILDEVDKQAGALRRQVWKCERYQRFAQEQKEFEIALAHHDYLTVRKDAEPIRGQIDALAGEKNILSAKASAAETRIETLQLDLIEKEKILTARQQDVNACDQRIHELNEQVLVHRERRSGLESRIQSADQECLTIRVELETALAQQKKAEQESQSIEKEIERARQVFQKRDEESRAFARHVTERKEHARTVQQRRLDLLQKQTEQRGSLAGLTSRLDSLHDRQGQLTQSLDAVRRNRTDIDAQAKQASADLKALTATVDDLMEQRATVDQDIADGQQRRDGQRARRAALETQLAAKAREHAVLVEMRQRYEGYGQGVRALLANGPAINGLRGTVADAITVDPPYAAAIQAFLEEALQYVFSTSTDAARSGIRYLSDDHKGKASFLLLDRLSAHQKSFRNPQSATRNLGPGVLGRATDFVRVPAGLEPAITHLLGHVLLVNDLDTAFHIADKAGADNGWRLLTLDGEVVDPAGLVAGGATADEDTGLLSRTARIEALEQEIAQASAEQAAVSQEVDALTTQLNDLIERRTVTERRLAEQQQAQLQAEKTASQLEFQRTQLTEREHALTDEAEQVEAGTKQDTEQLTALKAGLARLEQERDDAEREDRAAQEALERLEADGQRLLNAAQEARVALVSIESRGNELRAACDHLREQEQRLTTSLRQREQEIADATVKVTELKRLLDEGEATLKTLYADRREKETARDAVAAEHRALQDDIRTLQTEAQETRKALGELQDQIHSAELRDAELFMRGNEIRRLLIQQYDTDPETLPGVPQVPGLEEFDPDQARGLLQDVRRRIDELGPINLAAVDEYNAVKERSDFLTQQRDDLIEAKNNLEKTIIKMNKAARARFLDTFEEVRRNFMKTFQALFEGGESDLRLEDGDPLEAGIEIVARPHGKRLQSIALLSGGETALTAIALLFAIYLVKPSPFCIFDEVDAPLDDANIRRFAAALRQFATDTQFIVVTHNKRTMEAADCLYGVTMEEPGTSKIVSVRLEGDGENGTVVSAPTNGARAGVPVANGE